MAKSLGGDSSMIPNDKKIFVPTIFVHKANVDEFASKLKTLRGR
jgi:hypothetical protein